MESKLFHSHGADKAYDLEASEGEAFSLEALQSMPRALSHLVKAQTEFAIWQMFSLSTRTAYPVQKQEEK